MTFVFALGKYHISLFRFSVAFRQQTSKVREDHENVFLKCPVSSVTNISFLIDLIKHEVEVQSKVKDQSMDGKVLNSHTLSLLSISSGCRQACVRQPHFKTPNPKFQNVVNS